MSSHRMTRSDSAPHPERAVADHADRWFEFRLDRIGTMRRRMIQRPRRAQRHHALEAFPDLGIRRPADHAPHIREPVAAVAGVFAERVVVRHDDVVADIHLGSGGSRRAIGDLGPIETRVSRDASQNGLRSERPQRHNLNDSGASIGANGSQSTGSPNSVSTWAVRPSVGLPVTS